MNISIEIGLLTTAFLMFCSILISRTGYRFGIPTLLMFLLAGMLFGTDGIGLEFNDMNVAQNTGMIALCIILFTGGMDTKIRDIRPVLGPGISLSTLGVLMTTLLTGVFVYGLSAWQQRTGIGFSLLTSLLLAATMSSTDSASVFNILRSQKINLKYNLRPMLELESGSNDPMAYLLTVILIQCISSGGVSAGSILGSFVLQFAVGTAGGYLLGRLAVYIINRIGLKNAELYPITVLCFIFIIYCSTYLLKGNGYLAVYIAGIVMGNTKTFKKHEISRFLNGMTWLLQVVMFLILGLLVNPKEMLSIVPFAIPVALFMMLVARPVSVWISLIPFGRKITKRSKIFISWVGLRGAAPIIFATYPVVAQVDGADEIFNIVFFVTLISLLFQGMSLPQAARKLQLVGAAAEEQGNFGIEIPEEIGGQLQEMTCTQEMLLQGNHIKDLSLPKGKLVMLIKRNKEYMVPDGSTELFPGDVLLLISTEEGG